MKRYEIYGARSKPCSPFSILERIDVGETLLGSRRGVEHAPFSILERIDVGETGKHVHTVGLTSRAFSILERIDVGETTASVAL